MTPGEEDWRPDASLELLRERARILAGIRAFFLARQLLEVETPMLSAAGTTDPNIESFHTAYAGPGAPGGRTLWLHTSPEFPMKRLLAAGSGPIWQLCRVFRQGEAGGRHNPEFTLLEWYRPGFTVSDLMDEVAALVETVAGAALRRRRLSYRQAFEAALGLDPHTAPVAQLRAAAAESGLANLELGEARDPWLDLLMSHVVEPGFDAETLTFVHDYPASQAALARIRPGDPALAERFELYFRGMELANGFHELADADEQAARFAADRAARAARGQVDVPADRRLIAALAHGLPDCSGVALGVDRLVMALTGRTRIADVLAFPTGSA